jgi:aminoglycoside phosphotransferase family enzyme
MENDQLPAHVQALLKPGALSPEAPAFIQTHISFVLLTKDRAYKLKKPVDFGFLDYSTLAKRRSACEAEVALNRRFSERVYLGIAPITRAGRGYRLGGDGRPVDYAVVMRRLPEERMMDRLLERDAVTPEMLGGLARRLASFYADAPAGPQISAMAEPGAILANWQENFAQTLPYAARTIGDRAYTRIARSVYAELLRLRSLWTQRIEEGRARDGHGDLRCSAVCFEEQAVQVYDCIEFNERFRYGDVAADVAFLAMDLDGHGRPDLADEFVAAFVGASGDTTLTAVLPFYQCYRAYVRGKVDSFQLDEAEVPPAQRRVARAAARRRFALAGWYARSQPLTLAAVTGPHAALREVVAAAIAGRLGAVLIRGDDAAALAVAGSWLAQSISAVIAVPDEGVGPRALAAGHRARLLSVACGETAAADGTVALGAAGSTRDVLRELHRRLGLVPPKRATTLSG